MSTKEIILKKLEENRDKFISGEDLATELNLSRTAIWKAVNSLKDEGFIINSSTNKGYKLDNSCDKISKYGVLFNLRDELKNSDIIVYDSIDSTNTEAKRLLYSENLKNFTILISDEQTMGRGRTGKSFASPKGTGIYISIVLFPDERFNFNAFDLITVKAAVAVVNAIKNKTNKNPEIKWVNDIFLNHKKICGILSEADADFESHEIKSVIVGIGLNFKTKDKDFGKDLKAIAGSLLRDKESSLLRNEMAAEIINEFYDSYYNLSDEEVLKIYKDNSLLLGRQVSFEKNGVKYEAKAIDINDKGNLVVELENKEIMTLLSGEVSVKGEF